MNYILNLLNVNLLCNGYLQLVNLGDIIKAWQQQRKQRGNSCKTFGAAVGLMQLLAGN